MARQEIEYSVTSRHRTDGHITESIKHELLFARGKFLRPAKVDKQNNRLIYQLLHGKYFKFSLWVFAPLNSAIITIKEVNVDTDGIKETVILEYGMHYYNELRDILSDPKAQTILKKFIEIMPKPGNIAYVDDSYVNERINDIDIIQCIDRYLEEYLEERKRREWEYYDKVL